MIDSRAACVHATTDHFRIPHVGEVTIFRRIGDCTRILLILLNNNSKQFKTKQDYSKCFNAVESEGIVNVEISRALLFRMKLFDRTDRLGYDKTLIYTSLP